MVILQFFLHFFFGKFQIEQCVVKFISRPTGTRDSYMHLSKTSFPMVTLCPTNPYRLEVIQAAGILSLAELRFANLKVDKYDF